MLVGPTDTAVLCSTISTCATRASLVTRGFCDSYLCSENSEMLVEASEHQKCQWFSSSCRWFSSSCRYRRQRDQESNQVLHHACSREEVIHMVGGLRKLMQSKHPKLFTEYDVCLACSKSSNPDLGLVKIGICQSTSNLRAHKKYNHPKEYTVIVNDMNLNTPQSVPTTSIKNMPGSRKQCSRWAGTGMQWRQQNERSKTITLLGRLITGQVQIKQLSPLSRRTGSMENLGCWSQRCSISKFLMGHHWRENLWRYPGSSSEISRRNWRYYCVWYNWHHGYDRKYGEARKTPPWKWKRTWLLYW